MEFLLLMIIRCNNNTSMARLLSVTSMMVCCPRKLRLRRQGQENQREGYFLVALSFYYDLMEAYPVLAEPSLETLDALPRQKNSSSNLPRSVHPALQLEDLCRRLVTILSSASMTSPFLEPISASMRFLSSDSPEALSLIASCNSCWAGVPGARCQRYQRPARRTRFSSQLIVPNARSSSPNRLTPATSDPSCPGGTPCHGSPRGRTSPMALTRHNPPPRAIGRSPQSCHGPRRSSAITDVFLVNSDAYPHLWLSVSGARSGRRNRAGSSSAPQRDDDFDGSAVPGGASWPESFRALQVLRSAGGLRTVCQ